MKCFINILILTLFFCKACMPQDTKSIEISGFVKDSADRSAIDEVVVKVKGTNIFTYTNSDGSFSLSVKRLPFLLIFSHLGFNEKKVEVAGNVYRNLEIFLSARVNILSPVTIKSSPVENIIEKKPLFVSDYEFYDDKILIIAYREKNLFLPCIYLIDSNGDSVSSAFVKNPVSFYKDCLDYSHLITRNDVFQIYADNNQVQFLFPVSFERFNELFSSCVENLKRKFYLRQYYDNEQILAYYNYDFIDGKTKEQKVIADIKAQRMLHNIHGLTQTMGMNEFEERFEKMCFYKPVYAPLIKLKDTILIFNFVDSEIEFYNENGDSLKNVPIKFQNHKYFKREILVDEIKNKVYAHFKKDGISYLKEINLNNGSVENEIKIPEYVFVENIKVRDGIVYFLYKEKENMEYKKLYKMKI